jgi:hypothetical protein
LLERFCVKLTLGIVCGAGLKNNKETINPIPRPRTIQISILTKGLDIKADTELKFKTFSKNKLKFLEKISNY